MLDFDQLLEEYTGKANYEVKGKTVESHPMKTRFAEILPNNYRIEAMLEGDIEVRQGKAQLVNPKQLTGQQLWERTAKRAAFLRNLNDLRIKENSDINPYDAFLKVEQADLAKTPFNLEGKVNPIGVQFVTRRAGAFKGQWITTLTVLLVTATQPMIDEMDFNDVLSFLDLPALEEEITKDAEKESKELPVI